MKIIANLEQDSYMGIFGLNKDRADELDNAFTDLMNAVDVEEFEESGAAYESIIFEAMGKLEFNNAQEVAYMYYKSGYAASNALNEMSKLEALFKQAVSGMFPGEDTKN